MQNFPSHHATQNRVMAAFASSAAVFELPRAATLEDVAGHLAHLSERHDGALVSVDVRVGSHYAKDEPSLQTGVLSDAHKKPAAMRLRRDRQSFFGGRAK